MRGVSGRIFGEAVSDCLEDRAGCLEDGTERRRWGFGHRRLLTKL